MSYAPRYFVVVKLKIVSKFFILAPFLIFFIWGGGGGGFWTLLPQIKFDLAEI